jgi:hypothetical protein
MRAPILLFCLSAILGGCSGVTTPLPLPRPSAWKPPATKSMQELARTGAAAAKADAEDEITQSGRPVKATGTWRTRTVPDDTTQ